MITNVQITDVNLDEPLMTCLKRVREDLQKQYLCAALAQSMGNLTDAARLLDVSRRSAVVWAAAYEIDVESFYPAVRRERLAEQRKMAQQRAVELLKEARA